MKPKDDVLREALDLPPLERAGLVDDIISSLDVPDKSIDDIWKKEIKDRLEAYEAGKTESVSVKEVLAKYKGK